MEERIKILEDKVALLESDISFLKSVVKVNLANIADLIKIIKKL